MTTSTSAGERGGAGPGGGAPPASHCNLAIFSTIPTPPCAGCLNSGETSCCAEIDACAADPACVACLSADGVCTAPPPAYDAIAACVRGSCSAECYPTPGVTPDVLSIPGDLGGASDDCLPTSADVTCNPMRQSATCNWESGTACDVSPRNTFPSATGFACFLSNRRHIGETCGLVEGMCHFGLTCANYRCARYCCADSDCAGGRCDTAWLDWKFNAGPDGQGVGICVVD